MDERVIDWTSERRALKNGMDERARDESAWESKDAMSELVRE